MPDSTKTDRQGQTAKREQERGNKGQKQKSTHIMPRKRPHPLMMSHNYAVLLLSHVDPQPALIIH